MLIKRETTEDVYAVVLQRLSDMVKAGLPEPQCPAVETAHSSVARLQPDAIRNHGLAFRSWYTQADGLCLMKTFKGVSGEPTSL